MDTLDTDVVIVGGGAAGASAALEAEALGLDTVVVVKGFLGKSGCSIFAGNLNHFASDDADDAGRSSPPGSDINDPEGDEARIDEMVAFLVKLSHFIGDQQYIRDSTEYILNEFYPWAERLGLYLLRGEDGDIVSDDSGRSQAWAPKMGMSGTSMMQILRRLVRARAVRLLEQTMVTKLLVREGICAGIMALDITTGRTIVVRAPSVILATGHSNYLSSRSTGTREGCGAGWTLAARAGARLQNIEMQWYHASDIAYPATWMRLHMYPNPLPTSRHRSRLVGADGEVFFDGSWFPRNPVPYPLQVKHLAQQVQAGRARFDGGYFTSYTHVEPGVLRDHVAQAPFLDALGIDPSLDLIENGISYHMNAGGVRVDGSTMQTDVTGLFAAGSVNALITGGLPNVIYDGRTAARSAAARRADAPAHPRIEETDVVAEQRRIGDLWHGDVRDPVLPAQVKKRIRSIMWDDMNYVKNDHSMRVALDRLREVRAELLPRMVPQSGRGNLEHDLVDAIDVHEMLDACEMQVQFSQFRTESRGPFYREDYPYTDNVNWLKHVVGSLDVSANLELGTIEVPTPYAAPERTRVDFFETDY